MRVVVLGRAPGVGKSHVARRAAVALGGEFIEMDDMCWLPGWRLRQATPAGKEELERMVDRATGGKAWACASAWGAYKSVVLSRADTVVYLDVGFWRTLWQLVCRTATRSWIRQPVCNGNYESLYGVLLGGKSSIFYMFLKRYWSRQHSKLATLDGLRQSAPQARIVQLSSRAEVDAWISSLCRERS